jgi:hypothetical protein
MTIADAEDFFNFLSGFFFGADFDGSFLFRDSETHTDEM